MRKKIILDEYEQDIEDNLHKNRKLVNPEREMAMLREAARNYVTAKKSITLRVHKYDLEAMRFKASKVGVTYHTYIKMLIHQDACRL